MDWSASLAALALVFVAELGDKTQLAVVTQVCNYRRPWAVFTGASLALTTITALGAAGGQAVGRLVPQDILRLVATILFLVMGFLMVREALKKERGTSSLPLCEDPNYQAGSGEKSSWSWEAFAATSGLLFFAELGDKTQLAVFGLAGEYGAAWPVFLGGSLALIGVTALSVVGGKALCRLVPERILLWISAGAFVVIGAIMAVGAL